MLLTCAYQEWSVFPQFTIFVQTFYKCMIKHINFFLPKASGIFTPKRYKEISKIWEQGPPKQYRSMEKVYFSLTGYDSIHMGWN